jgi:hypothetical protein
VVILNLGYDSQQLDRQVPYKHSARNRASLTYECTSESLIIWCPEKSNNLVDNLSFGWGLTQIADNFRETLLHMDCIYDYFIDVLVPHIGWSPRQLPGWPTHFLGLARTCVSAGGKGKNKYLNIQFNTLWPYHQG